MIKRVFRQKSEDIPFKQFVNKSGKEYNYCRGIYDVHSLQIKILRPVRIVLSEKIHNAKIIK